jgi:hypothetical protein
MPAFTAIGAYVATTIFGLAAGTLAAAVVGGIVATGVAMLTSRLINGSPDSGDSDRGSASSAGTRVQLSPSTENKIPVLYGEAYCSGMVVDAYLDDSDDKKNNVMTYVMVISETCNVAGATYTVEDLYYNDLRLKFNNASDASRATSGVKYVDVLPNAGAQEDFTDDKFDGQVFINIYAGNTATKIFGSKSTAQAAVNSFSTHWDDTYKYQGLVFAVIQIKYDSEKGFTGLPQMTFHLKNTITNPAAVLADYMTSDRYGANIDYATINSSALAAFESYCNEQGPYKPLGWESGDPIVTQKRYEINGLINTNRGCKENIDTILLNSGAWISYDVALGQWRVIPKAPLPGTTWSGANQTGTPTDPSPQILFSDDNITSGIQISSTRLDNLYNFADMNFFDRYNKDQRGYHRIDLPTEDRNFNEPDNGLSLTLDLTNNNIQAERLANLELKQSRDDLIITFTAGHYGLQAQAGDVISVYNTLYGWCEPSFPNGKYFRVLSTSERDSGDGVLTQEITALEFNSDVYSNENIQEFTTSSNIGIIPRDSNPNIPAPIVEIGETNPNSGTPNFKIKVTIPTTGGPFDKLEVWYAEGDDWAGVGGDVNFKGQIFGTTLDVIQITNGGVIRANAETPNIYTRVSGTGVLNNTSVVNFGATLALSYGNGKTGQYTITPNHSVNTGIKTMQGWIQSAEFTASISDKIMTVTSVASGTIQLESLVRDPVKVKNPAATVLLTNDTIIRRQLTGSSGSTGTYELSKGGAIASQTFITAQPYPSAALYERLTTVVPNADSSLYAQTSGINIRDIVITGLPPNSLNKKYFIKCRLGIGTEFGAFSELSEVDLEPPVVYWNPDSESSLNIKQELVKMDFGKLTIPRNGLWLMRTAQQLDGGRLAEYNRDYFNLDLGNFAEEDEIVGADDIQDFTYEPND